MIVVGRAAALQANAGAAADGFCADGLRCAVAGAADARPFQWLQALLQLQRGASAGRAIQGAHAPRAGTASCCPPLCC